MSYKNLETVIREAARGQLKEEKDYEGQMARAQLEMIASRAAEVAKMMKDDTQLEAWVQSKITTAEDYVTTVHDYLMTRKGK